MEGLAELFDDSPTQLLACRTLLGQVERHELGWVVGGGGVGCGAGVVAHVCGRRGAGHVRDGVRFYRLGLRGGGDGRGRAGDGGVSEVEPTEEAV